MVADILRSNSTFIADGPIGSVRYFVRLLYENRTSRRPFAIVVRFLFYDLVRRIYTSFFNSDFLNPNSKSSF